jgi:hypothetical protein
MERRNKKACSACGVNKVNHKLIFFLAFLDELVDKLSYIYSPIFSVGRNVKIKALINKFLFNLLYCLNIVRYDLDINKVQNGRSKLIWEEAIRREIEIKQVLIFGKPIDYFRAKINGKIVFFNSLPIPPWLSQCGNSWVDDKFIFARKLEKAGIPSPKTRKVVFLKEALAAFDNFKKPIILKPKIGSLGLHTTTNINTKEELEEAFKLARQIAISIVLQEHLFGSVCRATVVNNKLVGFFRADLPFVLGDGVKSIKELILEKNKNRPERVSEILINEELLSFIERQNYNINSIIPSGTEVNLLAKTGRLYGGCTKEMLPEIHPKFHSIFKKASELVSIPVAGFDLIIEDPTKDPDTQCWGIIECNSLPFIDLHMFPLEGKPINVAKNVWDLWY